MISRSETAALLRSAIGRLARRLRQDSGHELTPSQSAVLAAIARHGGVTPSAVAEHERISRPSVTRIVAKLRARGLVEIQEDGHDRRSHLLLVSRDGAALRELRRGRKNEYLTRLLRRATADEVQLLAAAATVILNLLGEDQL